jgi:hypothetical protein
MFESRKATIVVRVLCLLVLAPIWVPLSLWCLWFLLAIFGDATGLYIVEKYISSSDH